MTNTDRRTDEILDIVAKETGVERSRLTPDAAINDLDIASLDLVQTIFAIEERYKVDIPVITERTGAEFQTVGDLIEHVLATLDKAASGTASTVQPRPSAG